MTQLTMGANMALSARALRATLSWQAAPGVPDVDMSALLLGESGDVGSDADFVFYNQPEHASGAVRLAGAADATGATEPGERMDIDLDAVPPDCRRIVLAASCDGGVFGQVPQLALTLSDTASGAVLATFAMHAATETAFVTAEIYRHGGGWKFRAVGQGYASGLEGLATDFGITVGRPSTPPGPSKPDAAVADPGVPATGPERRREHSHVDTSGSLLDLETPL